MKTPTIERAISLILLVFMLFSSFVVTASAANPTWTPDKTTKIYVDAGSVNDFVDLEAEAASFQQQYMLRLHTAPEIAVGSFENAGASDIVLLYDESIAAGKYEIVADGSRLIIAASNDDGIFYGCNYVVLKMVMLGAVETTAARDTLSSIIAKAPSVNKSALQKEVDQTPSLDTVNTSLYEERVLDVFATAWANANVVLANNQATQNEVDAALKSLVDAKKYIFVDYSALEAAVARSASIEANKDLYVAMYYEDYMNLVEEAKRYYLAEGARRFPQDFVDAMTETMEAARRNLIDYYTVQEMAGDLIKVVKRYYDVDIAAHAKYGYATEFWLLYVASIRDSERMLAEGRYDAEMIQAQVQQVNGLRMFLSFYKEADFAPGRRDLIVSGGFRNATAPANSTTRIAVNTLRSEDIKLIQVVDSNGVPIPSTVTVAPYNRRQPTIKTLYVDILVELEPGTYTYTIYVYDPNPPKGYERVMFCGDPLECTITVE
jgi:hypothetical protein